MKTVVEMAREAHIVPYIVGLANSEYIGRLERFAALVRADECEACAKLAGRYVGTETIVVAAIRARGETK